MGGAWCDCEGAVVEEKIVINKVMAEQEFYRFAADMGLDIDPEGMDEEDKIGFEQQKRRIVNAIMRGSLTINDNGEPIYTPQHAGEDVNPIIFHEPTGASLMAMDKKGKTEDMRKLFSVMGEMTKTSAGLFSKMKMRDLKVCQAVVTLFLA